MNSPKEIRRIALFTLDSFAASGGLKELVEALSDRLILICASQRFGGKYGSFFQQLRKNWKRSGFSFVVYQGINLIGYQIMAFLSDIAHCYLGRSRKILKLKQLARKYHIPLISVTGINEDWVIHAVHEAKPDLVISFYFDQVIGKSIISIPPRGVINVHAAKLPYCRGPFPILCSVLNDIPITISIHAITDETLDTGFLYLQKPYQQKREKSILAIEYEALRMSAGMILRLLKEMEEGVEKRIPQHAGGFYMSFPSQKDIMRLKEKRLQLYSLKEFFRSF